MMSCAESHLRVYYNIIFCFRNIMVECTVNYTPVSDNNRLEEILFPFFIPVLVFCLSVSIGDLCIGQWKVCDGIFNTCFVTQGLLNICGKSAFTFHKTLKSGFTKDGCQYIVHRFGAGMCTEYKFKVFHNLSLF